MRIYVFVCLLFHTISICSQNDPCKTYKKFIKSEFDVFTNTTKYYMPETPVYILQNSGDISLIWEIVINDLTERVFDKISISCDGELREIKINNENSSYFKLTSKDKDTSYTGFFITKTTKNKVYHRCIISIKNTECANIMEWITSSKRNKIRIWSDQNIDYSISKFIRTDIKDILYLYKCLTNSK